ATAWPLLWRRAGLLRPRWGALQVSENTGGANVKAPASRLVARSQASARLVARWRLRWLLGALPLLIGLSASEAAAIAFVKNIGTATGNNTGTTITITLPTGVSVAAGNSIILSFVSADIGTTFSATDSAPNGYSVDVQGARSGSVRTVILSAHHVNALAAGSTITVTFPSP